MKAIGSEIIIVGPDPTRTNIVGGVVKHVATLKKIDSVKCANIYDVGSRVNGSFCEGLTILFRSLSMVRSANRHNVRQVWINSSIYKNSIIKLLVVLFCLNSFSGKIRVFFHGGKFCDIRFLNLTLVKKLCAILFGRVDSFHFLCNEQGFVFSSYFPECKWELYSNYLAETEIIHHLDNKQKTFLFVGRFTKEKGIREILSAIDVLKCYNDSLDNISFWFAGEGPELEAIRNAESSLPQGMVKYLGSLNENELSTIYQSSYALLLPSYSEGFPYVVIEAFRAGLPVICTPCGALPDLVKPMQNGMLVNIQNVKELADAIRFLALNESLACEMRTNNQRIFLDRLSKQAAERYYSSLLQTCPENG